MFRNFGITRSRDDLIRRLIRERLARAPRNVPGPFGNFNPRAAVGMVDQLDSLALESTPEAAIAWIVEQFLVLGKRGYSWESAIVAIAQFRNEGLGVEVPAHIVQGTTTELLGSFVKSRMDAEFPTPEPLDRKFVAWAVKQCTFFFDKRGCTQMPIA